MKIGNPLEFVNLCVAPCVYQTVSIEHKRLADANGKGKLKEDKELRNGIYSAIERTKNQGDIFKPVLDKGINLEKVIKQFNGQ